LGNGLVVVVGKRGISQNGLLRAIPCLGPTSKPTVKLYRGYTMTAAIKRKRSK
jgi:hypothetical protein